MKGSLLAIRQGTHVEGGHVISTTLGHNAIPTQNDDLSAHKHSFRYLETMKKQLKQLRIKLGGRGKREGEEGGGRGRGKREGEEGGKN